MQMLKKKFATTQVPCRDLTSMADLHREPIYKALPLRSVPIAIPGAGDSEGRRCNEREVDLQHSDLYNDEEEQTKEAHYHDSPEPLKQLECPSCQAYQFKIHELNNQMDSLRRYIDSTLQ